MILSFYVARRFARMVLRVTAIFFGILLLIDLLDQLRRFSGRVSFGQAMELALLHVPSSLYTILPLIFILAAIALFMGLSRSSELVVMRAAGRAGLRILAAPAITAFLLGVGVVAVLNPLVAATSNKYASVVARMEQDSSRTLSVSGEGLWLRQGSATGQTVIRAQRANANGTFLSGVTILNFNRDGQLTGRTEAEEATLTPGQWTLKDAKRWKLDDDNPEATATFAVEVKIPSDLTPDGIRAGFRDPADIAIWKLPQYIKGLEVAGFQAREHIVWFQSELSLPIFLAAMVLIAAGFTMRHARAGRTGSKVLFALLVGFSVFFLRNFAQVLGESGQIPVILAAWIPSVAAVLASLGLLLHLEDG
ncbi:LPS export ABC transporter permease LptG [Falsirhodobacter sp. alg1]|uniref:LPS export ABC transporter permease LptG n=1 Tax=Falsirhodobacter sp. alg1 TaxID=1472418 RepID=UPI0005EF3753|nr:LPS export ABC transporter permease LptG [Falsirhodobacter sp. alg1]